MRQDYNIYIYITIFLKYRTRQIKATEIYYYYIFIWGGENQTG